MRSSSLLSLMGAASVQAASLRGFNYGSTLTTGAAKQQSDFETEFKRAQNLQGTSGFTAARLYTMIQADSTNTPISAIPAAIATKTQLLLGMWASGGQAGFTNEIAALKSAIQQYGSEFTDLVVGLSIGSEDLYRVSPTGIENNSGAGASPQELTNYISQVKSAISGTPASKFSLGHVDTWTAFVNGSNAAVIEELDWLGVDSYPYFENTVDNSMANQAKLFFESYNSTVGVAGGREVWITETGFPVSGKTENLAVPSVENAETYWQQVACRVLGNINTFWYTLQDAQPTLPNPSFGIIGHNLNGEPLYDLTCKATSTTVTTPSSSSDPSSTSTSSSKGSGSSSSSGKGSSSSTTTGTSSSSTGSSSTGNSGNSTGSTGTGSSSPSGTGSAPPTVSDPTSTGSTNGTGSTTSPPMGQSSTITPSNGAGSVSSSYSTIAAVFGLLFMVAHM